MVLLNQGYVRFFNLEETIDARLSLDNLGGGTISNDLVIFSGNNNNKSSIFFDSEDTANYELTDLGKTFKFQDFLSVYGNGDPVLVKTYIKIQNATYNNSDDSLTVTFNKPHEISQSTFTAGVLFTIEDTFFEDLASPEFSITIALNGKTYAAAFVNTTTVKLLNIGYPEQPSIGSFNPTNRNPYVTSKSLQLPTSIPQIVYDQIYYIAFSNAQDEFRLATNYSRTDKINEITFNTPFNKNIIFERRNTCTKENLKNLARPASRDQDFTYTSGSLDRTFNENFQLLEERLDSANAIRFKKYTQEGNAIFNTDTVQFEGTLITSDLDDYNSTSLTVYDPALRQKSPGVYILDPSSTEENIIALRAYSDNTQPWKLLDNPDPTRDVLEYQVLRADPADPAGQNSAPRNSALQEMQCGNLTLSSSDLNNSNAQIELEIDPTDILPTGSTTLTLSSDIFSHKLPMLINGEEYSVAVWNGSGTFF